MPERPLLQAAAVPFTVYAPINQAFAALPEGTVDTLLKPTATSLSNGFFMVYSLATEPDFHVERHLPAELKAASKAKGSTSR